MKSFLVMLFSNIVITGILVWGVIFNNEYATTCAVSLLWITAISSIWLGLSYERKQPEPDYVPRGAIYILFASAFDILNAILVISSGRPVLSVFILVGAAFSSYYISQLNKKALALGISK